MFVRIDLSNVLGTVADQWSGTLMDGRRGRGGNTPTVPLTQVEYEVEWFNHRRLHS